MNIKRLYVVTIGCQMNVYDSGQIKGVLSSIGYSYTDTVENADLIIVNTCSIRQKAEQKAFSFLGTMAKLKKKKPSLIIAIGGCLAQQEGKNILKRMPFIDLIFGSDAIFRLNDLIYRIETSKCQIVDVNVNISENQINRYPIFTKGHNFNKVSSFVTIMRGCDNYCTYCVVPYVRGREISLNPERIIAEVKELVSFGVKEVVLLGQNVNSYGRKNQYCNFVHLLKKINTISGLKRIRFTTSNPKDLSEDLMGLFSSVSKLCNHMHLPVQSGDDIILKRMNRKYNRKTYIKKVEKLRLISPGISITSDFIVGFPGESEEQFQSTINLIKTLRFDSSFAFSYSDRPNTFSSKFQDKVPDRIKKNRLQKLMKLQQSITLEINKSLIGNVEQILIEGKCNKTNKYNNDVKHNIDESDNSYWFGRTSSNRIVHFKVESDDNLSLKGQIVKTIITEGGPHFLMGELV